MFTDNAPCSVCGSEVSLHPHRSVSPPPEEVVGPPGGVVGGGDPTTDDRVCSNADCPTHNDPDQTP